MDAEKKCCSFTSYLKCKKLEILGFVMVILASIATLLSFNGLGLLGMLLVGWGFMFKRCFKCKCCPSTCNDTTSCSTEEHCSETKSTKTKKAKKD